MHANIIINGSNKTLLPSSGRAQENELFFVNKWLSFLLSSRKRSKQKLVPPNRVILYCSIYLHSLCKPAVAFLSLSYSSKETISKSILFFHYFCIYSCCCCHCCCCLPITHRYNRRCQAFRRARSC